MTRTWTEVLAGVPETEASLAADAVRRLSPPRVGWHADGHVVALTLDEVRRADEVRCVDCGALLKNRYGPTSPGGMCSGPRGAP